MTKAWGTAAVPAPHTTESGGDDQRWRILAIAGHGVDVQARHELGMQQLKDLQIDPGMYLAPSLSHCQHTHTYPPFKLVVYMQTLL